MDIVRDEVDMVIAEQERRGTAFDSGAGWFLLGLSLRAIRDRYLTMDAATIVGGRIVTSATTHHASDTVKSKRPPPSFEPDPEIIGNYEGNKRIQESDRAAARAILRKPADQR